MLLIDNFVEIFTFFQQNAADVMSFPTFLEVTISLIIYFTGRAIMWMKMEDVDPFKKNTVTQQRRNYILGHIWTEFFIGYAVAYFIVLLRGANSYQFIWNTLAAPGLGIVAAIMIDHSLLMSNEHYAPKGFRLSGEYITPITSTNPGGGDSNMAQHNSTTNYGSEEGYLSPELVNSVEFPSVIIKEINCMKDADKEHEEAISSLVETCNTISKTVSELQQAEVQRYGINLKKKIYACLGKGYATPEEYEEIEVEYGIYHDTLHGNSHIQALHDNKFADIEIREDTTVPVVHQATPVSEKGALLCKYGEFDEEIYSDSSVE